MPVADPIKIEEYYQALIDKDPTYTGTFYVGVRTTGVFCIATCRARKPKKENVDFYSSFKEALDYGFRPCKICKPTENAHQAPEQVEQAIQLVKDHTKEKVKDQQLRALGISPEVVRRWFKQHYGMTFQAFQRMYRMNQAFQELQTGKQATHAAYDAGYDSLSGFGYTYKKVVGKSPLQSKADHIILIDRVTTPLGPMYVCATEKGICLLEFVDRRMLETEFEDLQRLLKARIIAGENEHIQQAKVELMEYFDGKRRKFTVHLHTPATSFQKKVWDALIQIPFGKTASYQEQALKIGNLKAIRAVATANGCNRVAIIVPCHRVIGKDGSLTGYAGGLERKRWLLNHEQQYENGVLSLF